MDKIIEKIKSKKGISVIFLSMFMGFLFVFLMFVLDIGMKYAYRTELQQIADSMSLGGALQGGESYRNSIVGAKINVVLNEGAATSKANSLLQSNLNRSDNRELINVTSNYNFKEKVSRSLSNSLYTAGVFHVELDGEVPRLIGSGVSKLKVSSTTSLSVNGSSTAVNKSKIEIQNNETIIVYNANNEKIFEKTID